MIFSEGDHVEQIKAGTKTQTRRTSDRYEIGKLYTVQPCRTCKGIPDGKILIRGKRLEQKSDWPPGWRILPIEAKAEGGYSPKAYEELYEERHPGWIERWAYLFRYYSTEAITLIENGELDEAMALMMSRTSQKVTFHGGRYEDLPADLKKILAPPSRESQQVRIHGGKVEDIKDPKLKAILSKGERTS